MVSRSSGGACRRRLDVDGPLRRDALDEVKAALDSRGPASGRQQRAGPAVQGGLDLVERVAAQRRRRRTRPTIG
ncbi:hypothetical protein MAHJHV55_52610 [Mycobacterium avium subsp. hominissuis]